MAFTMNIFRKTIAAVAVVVSVMSVVEGSRVLLGMVEPSYSILPWLLLYNVAMGGAGLAAGGGLWLFRPWALPVSGGIAAAHFVILMILSALFFSGVAVTTESLYAMMFRSAIWIVIAWASIRSKRASPAGDPPARNLPQP